MASFNTTVGQMTAIFQRKNTQAGSKLLCLDATCLISKSTGSAKHTILVS